MWKQFIYHAYVGAAQFCEVIRLLLEQEMCQSNGRKTGSTSQSEIPD